MPVPDGKKIERLRDEMGWTQEKLAQLAKISKRSVQEAEAGRSVSAHTLSRIATAFEGEVKDLLETASMNITLSMPYADDPLMVGLFTKSVHEAVKRFHRKRIAMQAKERPIPLADLKMHFKMRGHDIKYILINYVVVNQIHHYIASPAIVTHEKIKINFRHALILYISDSEPDDVIKNLMKEIYLFDDAKKKLLSEWDVENEHWVLWAS